MVIPVGPPGAQRVLKVIKKQARRRHHHRSPRSDIYGGKIVPFVPFTKLEGDEIVGTHNQRETCATSSDADEQGRPRASAIGRRGAWLTRAGVGCARDDDDS